MKKDYIFFSTDGNGLTSTSANHIANLAKEMVRMLNEELDGTIFYSCEVALLNGGTPQTLGLGLTDEALPAISGKIHTIAEANALIAWLREAIKAKERLLEETSALTWEQYAKNEGIEVPAVPERKQPLTDDDYYASLGVDERNRYYRLQALAAVLGYQIHPGGAFAKAREQLGSILRSPRAIKGEGRDTLIYTYHPSVDTELVEETYFAIQNEYRQAQAALNAIKYECAKAVQESQVRVQTEYTAAMEAYNAIKDNIINRCKQYIQEKSRDIANMKILIPESLKAIYAKVNTLGKK